MVPAAVVELRPGDERERHAALRLLEAQLAIHDVEVVVPATVTAVVIGKQRADAAIGGVEPELDGRRAELEQRPLEIDELAVETDRAAFVARSP